VGYLPFVCVASSSDDQHFGSALVQAWLFGRKLRGEHQQTLGLAAVVEGLTRTVKRTVRSLVQRQANAVKLKTLPVMIQQRDSSTDTILRYLEVTILALTEFVLKEYCGGLRAEWRTFIEALLAPPVTTWTTRTRRLFQIHANPRQPALVSHLAEALVEVNRRKVRQGNRPLVFELVEPGKRG